MRKFVSILLWTTVFLLILVAVDQLLVRVPARVPAHVAAATFYRDLRSRVIDLIAGGRAGAPPATPAKTAAPRGAGSRDVPASVESLIEQRQSRPATVAPVAPAPVKPPPARAAAEDPAPRYVFADDRGELHFAETLAEIPLQYRDKARRLGE